MDLRMSSFSQDLDRMQMCVRRVVVFVVVCRCDAGTAAETGIS